MAMPSTELGNPGEGGVREGGDKFVREDNELNWGIFDLN